MASKKLSEAANELLTVRLGATAIYQLSELNRPSSLDESYRLQQIVNEKLATELGPPVGYKVGCTTKVMQQYLDIPHPCSGQIFRSTVFNNTGNYSARELCRPGVECEIAVRLKKDMPGGRTYLARDCSEFVGSVFPSIELVDDRWQDYRNVDVYSLIAENFFGAGCVIGNATADFSTPDYDSLAATQGQLWINEELIGTGHGADILGHPYEALAWLANHQIQLGSALRAGEIVSLGSVVQTYWLNIGDEAKIEFDGLGTCSLTLSD